MTHIASICILSSFSRLDRDRTMGPRLWTVTLRITLILTVTARTDDAENHTDPYGYSKDR